MYWKEAALSKLLLDKDMVYFALFTVGYVVGVVTFLFIFPPNMKEIEEQEIDALQPIINLKVEKNIKGKGSLEREPVLAS